MPLLLAVGGISPHVSPFTTVRDMGELLGSAGYTLVTLDSEELVVSYPGIWELMRDIKGYDHILSLTLYMQMNACSLDDF